jgi:putative addiction module component (TIGR02574 family)
VDPQTQAILQKALALPEAERELLVECLLESLDPPGEVMTDEEFAAELDRRVAELDADPSKAIPWSEVRKMS